MRLSLLVVNIIASHEKRQMTEKNGGKSDWYCICTVDYNCQAWKRYEGGGVVAGKQSGTAVVHFYLLDWWSNSRIWGAGKRSGTELILFLCKLALFGNCT